MTPVVRLDSISITGKTFFTSEGYFRDSPILTSTGIFEYTNPDGSIRRELRLPNDVFDPESLSSYQGKPIIITHDAGLIDKSNVEQEQIGTILTKGYEDGDDVRADIVIHNTDAMKSSHLRELSVGYNLDLEEKPGTWNGQHYDAIQRNIRVNHLALVRKARAGDRARLNLDGRDSTTTLKGGKHIMAMKKRRNLDGVLSPEELEKAISDYKAKRAASAEKKSDAAPDAEGKAPEEKKPTAPAAAAPAASAAKTPVPKAPTPAAPAASAEKPEEKASTDGEDDVTTVPENVPVEEQVAAIKERSENKDDGETAPQSVIKQQDYDIKKLLDIVDSLLAERDFNKTGASKPNTTADGEDCEATDSDDETAPDNVDDGETVDNESEDDDMIEDEDDVVETPKAAATGSDSDDDVKQTTQPPNMNTDSVDRMIRKRVKLGMIGNALNLDGLEDMPIRSAEKLVIQSVRPTVRLDGKSNAYIDAMFDYACEEIKARSTKDTDYQKRQMFNMDGRSQKRSADSSMSARERMIKRQHNKNKEVK